MELARIISIMGVKVSNMARFMIYHFSWFVFALTFLFVEKYPAPEPVYRESVNSTTYWPLGPFHSKKQVAFHNP
jgi:hypothetical protein